MNIQDKSSLLENLKALHRENMDKCGCNGSSPHFQAANGVLQAIRLVEKIEPDLAPKRLPKAVLVQDIKAAINELAGECGLRTMPDLINAIDELAEMPASLPFAATNWEIGKEARLAILRSSGALTESEYESLK